MMSKDGFEELLRGETPEKDEAASERARVRLRSAIAEERRATRHRRRRLVGVGAATLATAMLIVAVQSWLPLGRGGPDVSAAAEIRRLGEVAARQQAPDLGRNQFIYRRYLEVRRDITESISTGLSYAVDVRLEVEVWLSSDGSGRTLTTYQSVVLASPQDRASWEEAGSPSLPAPGETDTHDYGLGGLAYFPVDDLPTDPDALRQALAEGKVIGPAPGDTNLLSTIGSLLAQEDADGELRQALFDVTATIPNVSVSIDAVDPLGRPAVLLTVSDATGETSLFFDSSDAHFLGRSLTPPPDERPALTQWQAYEEGSVVSGIGIVPRG